LGRHVQLLPPVPAHPLHTAFYILSSTLLSVNEVLEKGLQCTGLVLSLISKWIFFLNISLIFQQKVFQILWTLLAIELLNDSCLDVFVEQSNHPLQVNHTWPLLKTNACDQVLPSDEREDATMW